MAINVNDVITVGIGPDSELTTFLTFGLGIGVGITKLEILTGKDRSFIINSKLRSFSLDGLERSFVVDGRKRQ